MVMHKRVFLSGVHGVGKGYLIKNILSKIAGLSVISASEMISKYHDPEDAGDKRVKDVGANQILVLSALKKFLENYQGKVLLDGHLVILDSNDHIQRIPVDFFKKGMFDTLIVLQDNPDAIYDRLYTRDGVHKLDKALISEIQSQEMKYAEELEANGVEVCFITPYSAEERYLEYFRDGGTNEV